MNSYGLAAELHREPPPELSAPKLAMDSANGFRILRDDGISDGIAGRWFASYDEAHAVLERYYSDLCCSDDREYYMIVEASLSKPS